MADPQQRIILAPAQPVDNPLARHVRNRLDPHARRVTDLSQFTV